MRIGFSNTNRLAMCLKKEEEQVEEQEKEEGILVIKMPLLL